MTARLVNKAIPKRMVTIVLTVEQCEAAGLNCKEVEMTTFVTSPGGVRQPKPITKRIPAVLRVLAGEEIEVHESILSIPKVQRAIARGHLRLVQGRSEVDPNPSRREAEPEPDTDN